MAQRASRQRGQNQGSHSWIMQSPLAQRVFGRRPTQVGRPPSNMLTMLQLL